MPSSKLIAGVHTANLNDAMEESDMTPEYASDTDGRTTVHKGEIPAHSQPSD